MTQPLWNRTQPPNTFGVVISRSPAQYPRGSNMINIVGTPIALVNLVDACRKALLGEGISGFGSKSVDDNGELCAAQIFIDCAGDTADVVDQIKQIRATNVI